MRVTPMRRTDLRWNHRLADILTRAEDGHRRIDYRHFHDTVEVRRVRAPRSAIAQGESMIARALSLFVALAGVAVAGAAGAQEEKVLNVYNWSDYIAEDTVANFEKETGIKVHYDVYDSNEVLEAKLLAGHSGYDVVVPSAAPYLARQATSGVYRKIDKAALKNYGNLDPQILAAAANADPGNQFGVPYMWGTTGFGYNRAQVKKALGDAAPTDSIGAALRSGEREEARALAASSCWTARRSSSPPRSPISHGDPMSRDRTRISSAPPA